MTGLARGVIGVLVGGLGVVGIAQAGQADICYGPTSSADQIAQPTNATVFQCPQAGNATLPQLAAAGWQVVQMVPYSWPSGGPLPNGAVQIVIQKP